MFTLATVSVVSSFLLWTVYHSFLDFNNTQIPQDSPDWQDISHSTRDPNFHDISEKIDWASTSPKSVEEKSDPNALNKNHLEGHVIGSLSKDLSEIQKNFKGADERPKASKRILSNTFESKVSLKGDTGGHDNINDSPESSVKSGDTAWKDNDYMNTYNRDDDDVYDDKDIDDDDDDVSSATVRYTDEVDQITKDEDRTDIKDKATDVDMTDWEEDGIKGTTEKSITQELHEEVDRSLIQEDKEITKDEILSEIQTFSDSLRNISDNVIKLIVKNKEDFKGVPTMPKMSSKMEENLNLKGRLADGNSASILYSLVSYIFHLESNKSLQISSQTRINTKNLMNLGPSEDITNIPAETRSHSIDTKIQQDEDLNLNLKLVQSPSSTPKPKIIKVNNILRVKTQIQDDFTTYLKGQTWEVFVTLAAVVVGVLLLMMFMVLWGTQHLRKRENRKRLHRIQAMENQGEI